MDLSTRQWSYLLLLIGLGSWFCKFSVHSLADAPHIDEGFKRCDWAVKKWASSSLDMEVKEDKHSLRDLLFFLHVPRTGGRTYFHCFLRKLYPNNMECPRSYDKLRFDPRKANCRLLVTHDDYSLMSKLPKEKTSVVTILRNPVDRVFSTYEFSIEVAARFLVHPNLTSARMMTRSLKKNNNKVSTLDIWPWKYLVPWMREDLFARRDARRHNDLNHARGTDCYNMEDMTMPLSDYINHPVASDIIHNGATFQVAGLTNNSYVDDSHEVRHCVHKYHSLGDHVLEVAKKRLEHMLYVGLTEDHKGSATMFGHLVGSQVISQMGTSYSGNGYQVNDSSEQSSSSTETETEIDNQQNTPTNHDTGESGETEKFEVIGKHASVKQLMDAYETCISHLWKSQSLRRVRSLSRIKPVNFTKKARLHVAESTLEQIRSLNWLDIELYKHAQEIVAKQREHVVRNWGTQDTFLDSVYGAPPWAIVTMALTFLAVVIFLFLYVNVKRRSSKIKI